MPLNDGHGSKLRAWPGCTGEGCLYDANEKEKPKPEIRKTKK